MRAAEILGVDTVRFIASDFAALTDSRFAPSGASGSPLQIVRVTPSGIGVRLEWTGPPGPYQVQQRPNLSSGTWQDQGLPIDAAQRSVVLPMDGSVGFFRLRLAR